MIHNPCRADSDSNETADQGGNVYCYSGEPASYAEYGSTDETGFSLVEMLLSAAILLVISLAVFGALNRIQQTASYQAEVQAVAVGDHLVNVLRNQGGTLGRDIVEPADDLCIPYIIVRRRPANSVRVIVEDVDCRRSRS